jgi:hypothetical protein
LAPESVCGQRDPAPEATPADAVRAVRGDPDASILVAESEFELNNQRITRARIEEYLRATSG